ncbi:hypothetical protein [Pedobacter steynii]
MAFLKGFKEIKTIKSHSRLYCAVDMRKFLPEVKSNMLFAFPAMVGLNLTNKKTMIFGARPGILKMTWLEKLGTWM